MLLLLIVRDSHKTVFTGHNLGRKRRAEAEPKTLPLGQTDFSFVCSLPAPPAFLYSSTTPPLSPSQLSLRRFVGWITTLYTVRMTE